MQRAVRVTLLPEMREFINPGAEIPADSVVYQEWVIPEAAPHAIEKAVRIQTYKRIESEVAKQFSNDPTGPRGVADYIGFLRGKLERDEVKA